MPTDLAWAGVSLSFHFNRYLWKTPLQWDSSRRRFLFVKGGLRKFFWWYFVIFVVYFGITLGSIVYVIHGQIYHPKPHIKFVYLVQYSMAFVAGWLAAAIAIFVAIYGEDVVLTLNTVIQFYEELLNVKEGKRKRQRKLFGIIIPRLIGLDGKFDRAGFLLFLILAPLPFIAFPLAPMVVLIVKNDVFRFVQEDILSISLQTNWIITIPLALIRTGLMFILCAESLRIFPFLVFILGITGLIMTKIVEHFSNLELGIGTSPSKWNRVLQDVSTMRVILSDVLPELARNVFILMGFGLVLSSSLNFATIRYLGSPDIALGLYLLFPFLAFVVWVVIFSLLPVAIGIHEKTGETLTKWKRGVGGSRDAKLRKRLAAMRPLTIYAGLFGHYFFCFDQEVMSTYMMSLVDNTANLLMSVKVGTHN